MYDLYKNTVEELEEVVVEEEISDSDIGELAQLVVYNDDHNTFEWVIQCFQEVLKHTLEQAEQLSLIIHFKGKATVKTAPKNVLKPKKDALVDRGLSAVIEGN
ncbi:MAG: ATP-dependent Clp protease adaptor ClpS [Lewinellaceae bacterium]|nr:ATP-dependent Clp protease adaptor ClpS [Phaeodactylibacter sp.]MCB0613725.1 ATP-dependent Clp protease adaptor ClpS [Phaeodactylibacter sp.]MCB9352693.1 ATP-dependent Clp protease adaptor ClpS [Lewinellaceae bacterium]